MTQNHDRSLGRREQRRFWLGWSAALVGTLLLVGLITLPPFVSSPLRWEIYGGFSFVCHQIPARSPHIDGVMLAVCHRCYGIYWGLPLAVLAFLLLRPWSGWLGRSARWLVPLSLVPMSIDWGGEVLGLWTNTPWSRLLTGGGFGLVAGVYLARAVIDLVVNRGQQVSLAQEVDV